MASFKSSELPTATLSICQAPAPALNQSLCARATNKGYGRKGTPPRFLRGAAIIRTERKPRAPMPFNIPAAEVAGNSDMKTQEAAATEHKTEEMRNGRERAVEIEAGVSINRLVRCSVVLLPIKSIALQDATIYRQSRCTENDQCQA